MAAPDVDKNHYLSSIPKIVPATGRMTLYASSNDKAMVASRKLAGGIPRAGDVPRRRPILMPPVNTIDASAVGQDILGLNHGTFAAKASILNDIKLLLAGMEPPRLVEISGMPEGAKPAKWWRYLPS
jgi:esterase/lipase superfamily enzyme